MKNLMLCVLLAVTSIGCAVKRTKDSDKSMRVAIDPIGMHHEDLMSLTHAMLASKKFSVVDRAQAFSALKTEQDMAHDSDRFENSQKYARFGKLVGVGSVIVTSIKCNGYESRKNIVWFMFHLSTLGALDKELCSVILELVDTNTGSVIAMSKTDLGKKQGEVLDFTDSVDELVENYPKYFEKDSKHEKLIEYESENEKLASNKK